MTVCDHRIISWLSAVYVQLQQGLEQLRRLHPACGLIPGEPVAELALGIFRYGLWPMSGSAHVRQFGS